MGDSQNRMDKKFRTKFPWPVRSKLDISVEQSLGKYNPASGVIPGKK